MLDLILIVASVAVVYLLGLPIVKAIHEARKEDEQ